MIHSTFELVKLELDDPVLRLTLKCRGTDSSVMALVNWPNVGSVSSIITFAVDKKLANLYYLGQKFDLTLDFVRTK